MKMALRTRLALSYLVVIIIGMGITAALAWVAVERLYLGTQSANLLAQAELLAAGLGGENADTAGATPYSQVSNIQPGIHTRLIDAQGAAVIDLASSDAALPTTNVDLPHLAQNTRGSVTPAELLARPEIGQAQQGRAATAVRRVDVAGGGPVLYAAAPVRSTDGRVVKIVYLAMPLPDTQWAALPGAVRWQFAGVLLAGFLLAGGAGAFLARRIARPLSQLARAAQAVSAGDLNQNAPVDGEISELGILGQAFNEMTASLRQSDQAKNAFIADVTHELRTPLTVIKGTVETLSDGAIDDLEARGPFLDSMARETERLIRLVNDLLVLTRADAGALNLRREALDLGELARSRCHQMEPLAGRRPVRFEVETSATHTYDCFVLADPDRIAQVLDNLLSNALRYSPAGGVIRVTIEQEGEMLACRVSDCGRGISAQHLPLIFERFYRAEPARERSQGGSGLGLAIVRSLVSAQGGRVAASSVEGQGTTISFWLPAVSPVGKLTSV
jgi:two-component system, OmpR family, sensor histidine kinase BaeS